MFKLNNLFPAGKDRKRVGRGGSRGGTAGRGHKGQKARTSPDVGPVLEGGQMPLVRRLPKRGFNNARFKKTYAIVNIELLNAHFESGDTVTKEALVEKALVSKGELVKVLGNGMLDKKLSIHVDACSKSAEEAIKNKGGSVQLTQEM